MNAIHVLLLMCGRALQTSAARLVATNAQPLLSVLLWDNYTYLLERLGTWDWLSYVKQRDFRKLS